MLSAREKDGLRKILGALEDRDIFSLVQTVSCGQLKVCDRKEAQRAILSCTLKPADLLRRKKILRELLFRYLLSEQVPIDPSLPKPDLIQACLKHWQSDGNVDVIEIDEEISVAPSKDSSAVTPSDEAEEQMAFQFTQWFFSLLNGHAEKLGSHHFFGSCQMKIECLESSQGPPQLVDIRGGLRVSSVLWELAGGSRRLFHPNSGSLQCYFENHGLAKIIVSGVIHESGNCVGLFDFMFGLAKDPSADDNWKIQAVCARLQVSGPFVMASLRMLHASESYETCMQLQC
ncbi:uncharacterized protein C3orf38 homolog [Ornithodoros turicata]|uniref:uncharacterized protein C3orf38 homolog n=1 Tax=Ornithodoros turicata TaxID=34597 RepID=UPI003138A2A5